MRLYKLLKFGLLSFLALGGGATVKAGIENPIVAKAELSWSDPSSSEFANGWTYSNYSSYYTNYSTLATGSGSALKTKLYNIIKSPSVTSYAGLWTAYKNTDIRSDGKIWDMYSSTTNYTYSTNQCGTYSAEGGCYNREHSLPKSWFNDATPMYTDIMHIVPTDGYVNGRRSNNPLGEVSNPSYSSNGGFSKLGPNSFTGSGGGTAFEPNDEYKGDFARIYFYMVTAYENVVANWDTSSTNLGGTSYPGLNSWSTEMLLKWSIEDPISEKEIARNTAAQNVQGNRNPYVDNSTFACRVFGPYNNATKELCQSSLSTPVTGVTLNTTSQSLVLGDTYQLTATISPNDASNKNVTWSTSNPSVASVSSNGLVTAKALGNARITVTTEDGDKTATCVITVNPVAVTSVSLDITSTTLLVGDSIELTATVSPSNATNKSVTWSSDNPAVASLDGDGFVVANSVGNATITVTTSDGSKTATCAITVIPISVENVSLNINSTTLQAGDSIQLTATVTPSDATDRSISWSSSNPTVASVDSNGLVLAINAGNTIITVTTSDGSKTATCAITVTAVSTTVTEVINSINTAKNSFTTERSTPNDLSGLKALINESNEKYDELSEQKQKNVTNSDYISIMNEVINYLETKWYGVVRIKVSVLSRDVKRVESEEWTICECISSPEKTATALRDYDVLSIDAKTILDETYDVTASDGTKITIGQSINFISNSAKITQGYNSESQLISLNKTNSKPYIIVGAIGMIALCSASFAMYNFLRKKER